MGYSLAITAYCQTCNRSHRAKDNELRRTSRIPESNLKVTPNDKKPAEFPRAFNVTSLLSVLPKEAAKIAKAYNNIIRLKDWFATKNPVRYGVFVLI